VEEDII